MIGCLSACNRSYQGKGLRLKNSLMTFCPAVSVSILEILALLHILPKFQFSNLLLNWHCVLNAQCVTHFGSAMCSLSLAYSSSNIPPNIHQLQISSNIIWAAQRGWYPQSNCHCPIGELLIRNVVMDHEDKYKYNTNTRVVSPIQRSLLSNCHRQSTSCYGHQTNTNTKGFAGHVPFWFWATLVAPHSAPVSWRVGRCVVLQQS